MNGPTLIYIFEIRKGQFRGRVFAFGGVGEGGSQARLIEGGATCLLVRINQDEFRAARGEPAIPETARVFDPVRTHISNVGDVPQVSRKKLLRALIVLLRSLRGGS